MKGIAILIVAVFLGIAVFVCLPHSLYLKNPAYRPGGKIQTMLSVSGQQALPSADVPVAAMLLYNGTVIGIGHNTVRKDKQAGGHAEINAISAAMSAIGIDSFSKLDRARLTLVTTWEPCPMCAGAISEYNIQHVVIYRMKPMRYWLHQWKKQLRYEWKKQHTESDTLQELLFKQHPQYNEQQRKGTF